MTIREKALEKLQEGPLDRQKLIPIIRTALGATDQGIRRTLQRMVHGGIIEKVTTPGKTVMLRISQKVLGELEAENKALREQIERFRKELKRLELKRQYNLDSYKAEKIRFGLISDTHLGSKYENLPFLKLAYDIYEQEGIEKVYHCGDITEGQMRHHGHEFEIHVHGMDTQADYVAEQYPLKPGITTKFITGSHDLSFYKSVGGDIGRKIADLREDLIYLGQEQAQVILEDKNENTATLRLIHPGGGTAYALCFDDMTEILTNDGWKTFSNLEKSDLVATLSSDQDLEWQQPTNYVYEDYSGEMIVFANNLFDLKVTPNHRMFVKRPWYGEWQFIEAENIEARQWAFLRTIPNWWGNKEDSMEIPLPDVKKHGRLRNFNSSHIPIEEYLEMLGWYLSEGSANHANQQVEINQKKDIHPEYYDEIVNLFESVRFHVYKRDNRIIISSKQLYEHFKIFGLQPVRYIPKCIKALRKEDLMILLETLFKGDGTFKNGKLQNYSTSSKQLADDIQEIALKCGLSAVIKCYKEGRKSNFVSKHPVYQISIGYKEITPEFGIEPQKEYYKGKIYCVSVPNEIILVRRNGKAIWTGNSYHPQKQIESLSGGTKPNIEGIGHYHKLLWLPGYRNIQGFLVGCLQHQTSFMSRKHLAAMQGFLIIEVVLDETGVIRCRPEVFPGYEDEFNVFL